MQQKNLDLFDFFDLEEARQLPCSSLAVFLDYLYSAGAEDVGADSLSVYAGSVNIRISGPRTDDGGQLYVRFKLTRPQIAALTEEERLRLVARLHELGLRGARLESVRSALGLPRVPAREAS